MKNLLPIINSFFESVPIFVQKNRIKMWLIFTTITIVFIIGATNLKLDNSLTANFQDNSPEKITYSKFRTAFGSDEILYIIYKAKDNNVFSRQSLTALQELQNELFDKWNSTQKKSGFSRITDIDTLLNVSYLEGNKNSLISRDFIETIPETKDELENLKKLALKHPDYPLLLVSKDAKFGGILIRTDFGTKEKDAELITSSNNNEFSFDNVEPGKSDIIAYQDESMEEYVPLVDSVRTITSQQKYSKYFDFYYSGNPEVMTFLAKVILKEMPIIILGSLLLIMIVLFILFRGFSAIVWPIVIVLFSVIWTVGTIGWSGLVVSDFINIIVFMLIAIGVADSIHILSGYLLFRREGQNHNQAILSVYKKSGFACFLTSLTTAIGLFAMTMVPIVSMSRFGMFAGFGVIYAFLITVFMLPLMLDLWSPVKKKSKNLKYKEKLENSGKTIKSILRFFENISRKRAVLVAVLFILFGITMFTGFFKINVDSNLVTIIREDQYIRNAFDIIDNSMAGTGNIEIYIDSGKENGCKDPTLLNSIDSLQKQLQSKFPDMVYKSTSLANIVKDSYRAINEGNEEMYKIPDDATILAQTLVLFDGANPKDRRLFVTDDYRKTRISINTRNIGSQEGEAFMKEVDKIIEKTFVPAKQNLSNLEIKTTGQLPLLLGMMSYMSDSQIESFAITFAVISILLLIVFGSIKTGLISVLPNLIPVLTVFGVMGYFNIPLDLHTLLVIPIIIGISVDDTIHFITHFKIEYAKTGNVSIAISNTMKEAGQAIIFTSIVLSIGYLIFLIAINQGFGYFGILCSISIFTATICDLIFLPAILRIIYKNNEQEAEAYITNQTETVN